MATERRYTASLEAQRGWSRLCALLRSFWWDDRSEFVQRRWHEDLGVRVSGIKADPLELIVLAISGEQALRDLQAANLKAFRLLYAKIEHPDDDWYTTWGTGLGQTLGLEPERATSLYEAGVEFMYRRLTGEQMEGGLMAILAD